jgi:PAS domain S-box-containing protein
MANEKVIPINAAELRCAMVDNQLENTEGAVPPQLEPRRLIHELEVHKIELEMQNAELAKSRDDLEEMLEKYTELYDFAPVGYLSIDQNSLLSKINLAGSGFLGINRAQLNGRRFTDFIALADRPAFSLFLERLFKSQSNEKCEVALINGGGPTAFVKIAAVAAVSGLECRIALMDITERKRAELALQKVEKAADLASQKLEAVAGVARRKLQVTAGIARRKVAQAIELTLHQDEETAEVASQRLEEAAVVAFQKMEEAANLAHHRVEEAAERAHLKVEEAAELVLPKEKETTEAVRKAADAARYMLGHAADMARLKVKETAETMFHALRRAAESEAQIKFAEERLRHEELFFHAQKLESLGVLAGGIAHDFNNILTSILGNIALAQMSVDETHESFKPLFFAQKAGIRAAELATRLLTFAKGGAPVKSPIALAQVLEESVALALGWANMKCVVRISEDLRSVEADEAQMSQVFHNIVINAAQAMPDGGTLTVLAENVTLGDGNQLALAPGSYVRISFADEGCGMPEEVQRRIFDPYYTTKSGGTGLGLASVYSIVMKHGGHIMVGSSVGSGTVFTCYLPSLCVTRGNCAVPAGAEPCQTAAANSQGKVLIMDDDALILNFTTQLLEHLGYAVTSCSNGKDAVALYGAALKAGAPFQSVIMDLTIPEGMGGKEAAQLILAKDRNARLIVSSGYSSDPVMADFLQHGFCAALPKPYRVSELAQTLVRVSQISGSSVVRWLD